MNALNNPGLAFLKTAPCVAGQRVGRQSLLGIQSGGADGRQDSRLDVAGRIVRLQTRHEQPLLRIRGIRHAPISCHFP